MRIFDVKMLNLPPQICSHSIMDRISDSGSDDLGSTPNGSTKKGMAIHSLF